MQSYAAPPPFTISDLSKVWVVCDVWENNMAQVHIGEYADIHLAAYPDRVPIPTLIVRLGEIRQHAKVRSQAQSPRLPKPSS